MKRHPMAGMCIWAVAAVGVGGAGYAWGEEAAEAAEAGEATAKLRPAGWHVEVQPYLFMPLRVDGTASVGEATVGGGGGMTTEHEVPIDITAGDLIDELQFAAEVRTEVWRGRWGGAVDLTFVQAGSSGEVKSVPFELTSRMFVGDLLAYVNLGEWALGRGDMAFLAELGGGARVVRLQQDIDVGMRSFDASDQTVKGLAQGRVGLRLSRAWLLGVRGTVAAPDVTWSVLGGVEWLIGRVALKLGYRYDSINYSIGRASIDVTEHGPYLGVGIGFGL